MKVEGQSLGLGSVLIVSNRRLPIVYSVRKNASATSPSLLLYIAIVGGDATQNSVQTEFQ